jgi:hypothetical protein
VSGRIIKQMRFFQSSSVIFLTGLVFAGACFGAVVDSNGKEAIAKEVLVAKNATKAASEKDGHKPQVNVPELPGIKIDRKNRVIDLKGKICMPQQTDWLELLVCKPKTREHESIISLIAKPSHVHGALLLIGLKHGKPYRATYDEKKEAWKHFPPTGDAVAVSIVYKNDKGKQVEVKANEWLVNQQTKKKMPDNVWLFTGSKIRKIQGRQIYAADLEGNVITVVNFGDEVLSRRTDARGGQGGAGGDMWGAGKNIPKAGTEITIRLRPAKKAAKPK